MPTVGMQGGTLVILLVEDNLSHAELVKRSLGTHALVNTIYHVRDGEAALAYLFRRGIYADPAQSPRPHVVLLDLQLPKRSGLEVLRELRTSPTLRMLPVVVLTTSAAERDVLGAYEHYANSYLVKPVDFEQFMQLMHDLGTYWLRWNHYPTWADETVGRQ